MNETIFEKSGNQLMLTRVFDAPVELVWRAWTEATLLDQWWAPKPWMSKTVSMTFEEGGNRLYAMCGPNGEEHWCRTTYRSIILHIRFSGEDAFCDDKGMINPDFPIAEFEYQFDGSLNSTTVKGLTRYASPEHLQQVIDMGMEEGFRMACQNLDNLLMKMTSI